MDLCIANSGEEAGLDVSAGLVDISGSRVVSLKYKEMEECERRFGVHGRGGHLPTILCELPLTTKLFLQVVQTRN